MQIQVAFEDLRSFLCILPASTLLDSIIKRKKGGVGSLTNQLKFKKWIYYKLEEVLRRVEVTSPPSPQPQKIIFINDMQIFWT